MALVVDLYTIKLCYLDGETRTVKVEAPIPTVLLVHHPLRGARAFQYVWEKQVYIEASRFEEIGLKLP